MRSNAPANSVFSLLFLLAVVATTVAHGKDGGGEKRSDNSASQQDSSARTVAAHIDELINRSLADQGVIPAPLCTDEDFLRRASLDLTGNIPTSDGVIEFRRNREESKRTAAIERMLESDGFAETWASYWREVIFSRATDMRSRRTQGVFENWMTEQLEAERPWDEIVTDLLTATGDTSEDGSTGLIFAHGGDAAELASETSRIFLGIQIQCANCHDHPYDTWKRQDFHELAAYFPRIRVRRDKSQDKPTFQVQSVDNDRDDAAKSIDPNRIFRVLDKNNDGQLTRSETKDNKKFGKLAARLIKRGDKDADGMLSKAELKALPQRAQNQPGRGRAEYFMPDLEDPTARGTRTQPVFFVDEASVPIGTKDLDRRSALAESIVSPDNEWFAKAFVNRIWAELLGQGFYAPIDDMGPQRTAQMPEVIGVLSTGFIDNGYDIKWLYRTIVLTDAYQRSLPSAAEDDGLPAFAAMSPTRLRGDQIFNAVSQILRSAESKNHGNGNARAKRQPGKAKGKGKGKFKGDIGQAAVSALFNYDPSTPQADLTGNIPQALFMMNSPVINNAANSRGQSALGHILKKYRNDDKALSEIYLRVLSREPNEAEARICREHLDQIGDREAAFEDILWSLLNSSEFLTKR